MEGDFNLKDRNTCTEFICNKVANAAFIYEFVKGVAQIFLLYVS